MATPAQIDQHAAVQARVVKEAHATLRRFWLSLDLSNPEVARDALMEFMPALVNEYGNAAGVAAADFYDQLRSDVRTRREFKSIIAGADDVATTEATRRLARSLFEGDAEAMIAGLEAIADKQIKQVGRDTITRSSISDPDSSGWQREIRGDTCKFCRMLASRGAVYRRETADFAAHHHCDCVAAPSFDSSAPEVSATQYVASERTSRMTDEQKARHRETVAGYLENFED
ncbi:hypothetical protein LGT39_05785 [Demequina sp. TTPB684]|uniref:VG15 protein n=1 Tax=unclassified Demequina TaxID=2620311 RepID=UPI001CF22022|nr:MULTISPECIES: hypothetical protein [unclassified Demequina]MCB2412358.1 hypothetical protein [Demequina sp. TTPB684]UPU89028.1 hypothetical protein LGT36_003640 [Demequina sp. TMPB413]